MDDTSLLKCASFVRSRLAPLLLALCLALAFLVLAGGIPSVDPLKSWRARLEDLRWHWRVDAPPASPVVVVDIDDASLAKIGYWPWPRERMVQLVRQLFEHYGAAVVGLDILYPEASSSLKEDHALGDAGRRYPLVFSQAFELGSHGQALQSGLLTGGAGCPGGDVRFPMSSGVRALSPTLGPLPFVGHVSPLSDSDGILRRTYPLIDYRGRCYPSLSLAMLGALANLPSRQLQFAVQPGPAGAYTAWLQESALGLHLPMAPDGSLTIPWRSHLPIVVPVIDVIDGRADAALLHNSMVLIGSSAAGLGDLVPTPLYKSLPGVMVHAAQLESMIDGRWQVRPPWASWLCLLFCWVLAALLLMRRITDHPWRSLLMVAGGSLLWFMIAWQGWLLGQDLPLFPPFMVLLLQMPVQAAWQGFAAQLAQYRLYRQFSAYLPRDVLRQLVKTGADPRKIEAQRCEISVLFVDLVGFTRLAESMSPESVAKLLNIVMEQLAKLVHAYDGTLDKFIGDALMAFWGAPLPQADHADRAVACAQAMLAALPAINRELAGAGLPQVLVGIGINSGPAAVGNLGSRERRAYTAVGDTVNLACRLEGLTRELNEPLLLGESTCQQIQHGAVVPLGRFALRGREQLYRVFKPV